MPPPNCTAPVSLTCTRKSFISRCPRLLGAPPGYVGSEEEGRLTGAVRRAPYSIVLFDEIEKAHPRIFDIFLPILDEGRLKDARGRDVSFKNCIIIMTSNVGAALLAQDQGADRRRLVDELARHFRPEFINRIDEIVPFYPLLFEDIRAVLLLLIKDLTKRLLQQKYDLRMYQKAYELLAEKGYSQEFGARELKRTVETMLGNPISDLIVRGEVAPGDVSDVLIDDGKLAFHRRAPQPPTAKASPSSVVRQGRQTEDSDHDPYISLALLPRFQSSFIARRSAWL